jgi:hypothetical protein
MLEPFYLLRAATGDDQIIHVHAKEKTRPGLSTGIHHVLRWAPREAERQECDVELGVPGAWGLT